ncbi:hypothetical protein RP20_CCG015559, partial [Aedes albopictus]
GPLFEVQTAVGLDVSLPCDLLPTTMTLMSDKVTLIIWYKEGNSKPIYSFDARGKSLQQAIHWSDEAVLKSKAYFYYETNPPALRIKNIKQEDAGLYRCRVDFQKSPTRNCRIDLDVLVPPSKVTILDELGAAVMDSTVGPYKENVDINLTCVSSGGVPTPKVTWWKEHALLDDSFIILPDGTVKNVLYLEKLTRSDLNSVYTCQASNGHVVPPLSTNVKLTLNLPPLFITMQGLRETLTAGIKTQVSCHTAGSRPSPNIMWSKGATTIRGSSQTTSNDGNVTVSELVFVPGPEDNEKSITCSIEYPESEGATIRLKDSHVLDVKHVPVISLSLGAPLDSQNLMEGSDVYLECDIKANPPAKKIEWFHNIFDEHTKKLLLSITYQGPEMLLKKLPSDTKFIIKITPFNLQGTAPTSYRVKAQTLPAPLLRTAPSKAVLVQLTPLLGALVGAAVTLYLHNHLCQIQNEGKSMLIIENKKHHPTATTEQDKGSAEPLSRNIGSHSSIDDKNPDVIPHENSEDDDEKQFERLVLDTERLKFTPTPVLPSVVTAYSPTHVSPTGNGMKKFGELSLTTNPSYAIYNSPVRSAYGSTNPSGTTTTTVLPVRTTSPNIYTRLPLRDFTPNTYDSMLSTSQAAPSGYATSQIYTAKMPLLTTNYAELASLDK